MGKGTTGKGQGTYLETLGKPLPSSGVRGLTMVYAMGFSFIQIYFYYHYCYIIYIWSVSTALPVNEMLIYWLMQYLLLHLPRMQQGLGICCLWAENL